jgi:hypothetical protein
MITIPDRLRWRDLFVLAAALAGMLLACMGARVWRAR